MASSENEEHNKIVLATLEKGHLIEFQHQTDAHWGVYLGDNIVAHLTRDEDEIRDEVESSSISADEKFSKAFVTLSNFFDVAGNSMAKQCNFKDAETKPHDGSEIMMRVAECLFEKGTHKFKTSKDFATWCRYGESKTLTGGCGHGLLILFNALCKTIYPFSEYSWVR